MSKFYLLAGAEYDTDWGIHTLQGKYDTLAQAQAAVSIHIRSDGGYDGFIGEQLVYWAQVVTINDQDDLVCVASWYYLQRPAPRNEWVME